MAQIQDNLNKASFLWIPLGEIGDQLSSGFGFLWPTQDDYYDDNELYHWTFTADWWTYSDEEKKNISAIMKQIGLTSSTGFKPKITIKKIKRKDWDPFVRTIKRDGITNNSEYINAIQQLARNNTQEEGKWYAYEISVENGWALSEEENINQQLTTNAYNNIFEWKYYDGTKISANTFQKYTNEDGDIDLNRFLKDSKNANYASVRGKEFRDELVQKVWWEAVWNNLVKSAYLEDTNNEAGFLKKTELLLKSSLGMFYENTDEELWDNLVWDVLRVAKIWDYDQNVIESMWGDLNYVKDILASENYWNNDWVGSFVKEGLSLLPDAALVVGGLVTGGTSTAAAVGKAAAKEAWKQAVRTAIKKSFANTMKSTMLTTWKVAWLTGKTMFVADQAWVNMSNQIDKYWEWKWDIMSIIGSAGQIWLAGLGVDFAGRMGQTLNRYGIAKLNKALDTDTMYGILTNQAVNSLAYTSLDAGFTMMQWRDVQFGRYFTQGLIDVGMWTAFGLSTRNTRAETENFKNFAVQELAQAYKDMEMNVHPGVIMSDNEVALRNEENNIKLYNFSDNHLQRFNELKKDLAQAKELWDKYLENDIVAEMETLVLDKRIKQQADYEDFVKQVPELEKKRIEEKAKRIEELQKKVEEEKKQKELQNELNPLDLEEIARQEKEFEEFKKKNKEIIEQYAVTKEDWDKVQNKINLVEKVQEKIENWEFVYRWEKILPNTQKAEQLINTANLLQKAESRIILNKGIEWWIYKANKEVTNFVLDLYKQNNINGVHYDVMTKEQKKDLNDLIKLAIIERFDSKLRREELLRDISVEKILQQMLRDERIKELGIEAKEIRKIANELLADAKKDYQWVKNALYELARDMDAYQDETKWTEFDIQPLLDFIDKDVEKITSNKATIKSAFVYDKLVEKENEMKYFNEIYKKVEDVQNLYTKTNSFTPAQKEAHIADLKKLKTSIKRSNKGRYDETTKKFVSSIEAMIDKTISTIHIQNSFKDKKLISYTEKQLRVQEKANKEKEKALEKLDKEIKDLESMLDTEVKNVVNNEGEDVSTGSNEVTELANSLKKETKNIEKEEWNIANEIVNRITKERKKQSKEAVEKQVKGKSNSEWGSEWKVRTKHLSEATKISELPTVLVSEAEIKNAQEKVQEGKTTPKKTPKTWWKNDKTTTKKPAGKEKKTSIEDIRKKIEIKEKDKKALIEKVNKIIEETGNADLAKLNVDIFNNFSIETFRWLQTMVNKRENLQTHRHKLKKQADLLKVESKLLKQQRNKNLRDENAKLKKEISDKKKKIRETINDYKKSELERINNDYAYKTDLIRAMRDADLIDIQTQKKEVKENYKKAMDNIRKEKVEKYREYANDVIKQVELLYPNAEWKFGRIMEKVEKLQAFDKDIADVIKEEYAVFQKDITFLTEARAKKEFNEALRIVSKSIDARVEWQQFNQAKNLRDAMRIENGMRKVSLSQEFNIATIRMKKEWQIALKNKNFFEASRILNDFKNLANRLKHLIDKHNLAIIETQNLFEKEMSDGVSKFVDNVKKVDVVTLNTQNVYNVLDMMDSSWSLKWVFSELILPSISMFEQMNFKTKRIFWDIDYVLKKNGYSTEEFITLMRAMNAPHNYYIEEKWEYKNNIFVDVTGKIVIKDFNEVYKHKDSYEPFNTNNEKHAKILQDAWAELNSLSFDGLFRNKLDMKTLLSEWEQTSNEIYGHLYLNSIKIWEYPPKMEKYYIPTDRDLVALRDEQWRPIIESETFSITDAQWNVTYNKHTKKGFTKWRKEHLTGREYQMSDAQWRAFTMDTYIKKLEIDLEATHIGTSIVLFKNELEKQINERARLQTNKKEENRLKEIQKQLNEYFDWFIAKKEYTFTNTAISALSSFVALKALWLNVAQFFVQKVSLFTDMQLNWMLYGKEAQSFLDTIPKLEDHSMVLANLKVWQFGRDNLWQNDLASVTEWIQNIATTFFRYSGLSFSDRQVKELIWAKWFASGVADYMAKHWIEWDLVSNMTSILNRWEIIDKNWNTIKIPDIDIRDLKSTGDKRLGTFVFSNIKWFNPRLLDQNSGTTFLLGKTAMWEFLWVLGKAILKSKNGKKEFLLWLGLLLTYLTITANASTEVNAVISYASDELLKYARENNDFIQENIWLEQWYKNWYVNNWLMYSLMKDIMQKEDVSIASEIASATAKWFKGIPLVNFLIWSNDGSLRKEFEMISKTLAGEAWYWYDYLSTWIKIPGARNYLKDLWYQYKDYAKNKTIDEDTYQEFLRNKEIKEKIQENREHYRYLVNTSALWLAQWDVSSFQTLAKYNYYNQTEEQQKKSKLERERIAYTKLLKELMLRWTIQNADSQMKEKITTIFNSLTESQRKTITSILEKEPNDLDNDSFFIKFNLDMLSAEDIETRLDAYYRQWIIDAEKHKSLKKHITTFESSLWNSTVKFEWKDLLTNLVYEQ